MKSYLMLTLIIVVLLFYIAEVETTPRVPLAPPPGTCLPPGGITWINCTRPNEFYDCGSACQTTCKTLGAVCPIINVRCNDDCYCIKGFARDDKNKCIPIEDCPKRHPCEDPCKSC
ncbi:inducible metalloproteinase inhibitor protein-like [Diabrotica virgifera virgifera]|uniref:TIL domain-containing protein n=1 Tax=Diabrotica virgifera virgifera TaxID=50390 RepID=A0ABM5KNU7_DIAVI|nr:inducible metalloproteinase inhibitor protein-like [Diabrotica virgifera virgifera]